MELRVFIARSYARAGSESSQGLCVPTVLLLMLERLTKTPEYRVFWVITSARAVLTAAMSVGAEVLGKYRTKPEVFKY